MSAVPQAGSLAQWAGQLGSASPFGHDLSTTVAAGTNTVLVLMVQADNAGMPAGAGATWNGTPMTLLDNTPHVANSTCIIYYLVAPAVGTFNVNFHVGSWYGQYATMAVAAFDGVNQSTPFGTPVKASSSAQSSPNTLNLTAGADDATVAISANNSVSGYTLGAGETQFGAAQAVGTVTSWASYKAGASSSMSRSWSSGAGQASMIAVVLNAAPVPPNASMAITTDDAIFAGSADGNGASVRASMAISTDDAVFAGNAGTQPATITTLPFVNWSGNGGGSVLANTVIPIVNIMRASDGACVLVVANQSTDSLGRLVITSAALVSGVKYMVAEWNGLTASLYGMEPYTAV